MVLHAYVLVNRSADRYVATFSISESASSVEEATAEVEAKTHAFMQSIEARVRAVSVDPVTQVELFEYEYNAATGATIATEVHAGFEVQRNVIVTYERSDEIGVLAVAAAEIGIHDIARVEYVTDDIASVRAELFETAASVIAEKRQRYEALGVPLSASPLAAEVERYATVDPPELYARYEAFEAASVDVEYPYGRSSSRSLEVRRQRKPTTYFWRPLDESGFDRVLGAGPTEPVVQHTLLLTVRYSLR